MPGVFAGCTQTELNLRRSSRTPTSSAAAPACALSPGDDAYAAIFYPALACGASKACENAASLTSLHLHIWVIHPSLESREILTGTPAHLVLRCN